MKQNINEIKRMQQLAGILKENMGELVGNAQPTPYMTNVDLAGGWEALSVSELLAWANYAYPKIEYTPETPVIDLIEKLKVYYDSDVELGDYDEDNENVG